MALVLRGGRMVDPGRGTDAYQDVRIEGGRIAAVGRQVSLQDARVYDLQGAVVTPGLIDGHVHVYEGVGFSGIDPDIVGVGSGVTTVVDAGSSGAATFEGLRRYVMARAKTEVLALVSVSLVGAPGGPNWSELSHPKAINEDITERVVEAHRDVILGLKLRASRLAVGALGLEPIRRARALADRVKLPLVVHIGEQFPEQDPPLPIQDVVRSLCPGDILTHLFTGQAGGVLDPAGRLVPEVREAYAAGVRFDVGLGRYNFSVDTARRILDQGVRPHTISSDVTRQNRDRVVGLPTTMAKMLHLGFALPEVVGMVTVEAARSLRRSELAAGLGVGASAALSVFRLEEAEWEAEDSMGKKTRLRQRIVPLLAIRGDEVFEAQAFETR